MYARGFWSLSYGGFEALFCYYFEGNLLKWATRYTDLVSFIFIVYIDKYNNQTFNNHLENIFVFYQLLTY